MKDEANELKENKVKLLFKKILDILKKVYEKIKEFKGINIILRIIILLIFTFLIIYLSMLFNESNFVWDLSRINERKGEFWQTSINDVLLNYIFTFAIIVISVGIIGSLKASIIISIVIWTIVNIANVVLLDLRGTAFSFADIFSVGTALSVVNGMKVDFTERFFKYVGLNIILVFIISLIKFGKIEDKKKRYIARISNIVFGIVLFILGMNTLKFQNLNYWDLATQYRDNGVQLVFIKQIDDFFISKPKGYSIAKAEEILNKYEIKDNTKTDKEKVNVIVVMNESFSDINKEYNLGLEDNLLYYNSLKENTIKGTVYSSVFGGGTAMAEWELLTGNSSAFLPVGSIPYIVYLRDNRDTLVSNFRINGYQTVGLHSYYEKCYNRHTAYDMLGFEQGLFKEDMENYTIAKSDHPDDASTYKKLLEAYESRDKNRNFFGFVLTMQNHSPYTFEDYNNKGYYSEDSRIDQYLSLVNESDKALEEFINYFENEEEKTIILFFGDHQPKVAEMFSSPDEWLDTQKVPYMLWANYDIEEKDGEDISTNFLSTLIYEYAGIENTKYIDFLNAFRKEIPVFTLNGYKDKDGKTYIIDDETSPYTDIINEYKILEYYFMFDKRVEY